MEMTNEVKIEALKWLRDLGFEKRVGLMLKHCNKAINLTAHEAVIIWRRETGGEWKHLLK